ncbi:MAG: hypothetical protein EXR47_02565 [Dehalococcoidia bacterium]|nr:hypothetical protein [Dehalococcoidia bacterium]
MAYMLSAQLAAMSLNVKAGFVSPTAYVWTGSSFMPISTLIANANTELGLHPLTPDPSQYRAYQEFLKNALDRATTT